MDFASEWMSGAKPITTFHWTDCKPIDFFGAFFSDSSKFQEETHRVRGDKNCSCERWAPSPMGFHSRVRKFSTGYKTPLGEMGSCRMKETQRVKVLQAATTVLMVNTMNLAGVPYSDYYEVHTQFIVNAVKDGIEVRVFQAISWLKSTWLKGKIGAVAYERCVDSFKVWPQNSLPTLRTYVAASRKPLQEGSEPQLVPSLAVLLAVGGRSPSPRQHPDGAVRRAPSPPTEEHAGQAQIGPSEPGEERPGGVSGSSLATGSREPTDGDTTEQSAQPFSGPVDGGGNKDSGPLPSGQRTQNDRWSLGAGDEAWWSAPSPRARRGDRDVVRIMIAGDSIACCAGLVRQFANASLPCDETATETAGANLFDATDPFAWAETAAEWWGKGGGTATPSGGSSGNGSSTSGGVPATSVSVADRSQSSTPLAATTNAHGPTSNVGRIGLDGSCVREVSLHAQSANVLLSVWDMNRTVDEQCSCDAAIVLYDVTSRESFHHAEDWVRRLRRQDESGDEGPIISLVGTHADVAISDDIALANLLGRPSRAPEPEPQLEQHPDGAKQVVPLRLEPVESGGESLFETPDSQPPEELKPEDPGWDTASDDSFFDAIEHDDAHGHTHRDQHPRDVSSGKSLTSVDAGAAEQIRQNRPRRVVSLEEGEVLAGRIAARSHFELPALVGTRLSPLVAPANRSSGGSSGHECGHPVTQVVYSLLSDLLLGDGWHPELLATRQRLAWAVVALPHQLPPRLPLTTVMHVAHLLGRCASRPVLTRERLSEAELWHRRGHYERALEGYAHVLVAAGKDEAVEAAMRRAEAARWRQSHDEAIFGGESMLGGMSPPSSSIAAAAATDRSKWWLWVDDSYSSECFRCRLPFTFFRRRHHCRHCGHLFCGACSDKLASGLWRIPPSPKPAAPGELEVETAATAAGASANEVAESKMVLGFVGSKSRAEIERLERGVREVNLERVCRGCWKVLRTAEKRAQSSKPNATATEIQEASLRRRAALSAGEHFLSAESDASSVALVQFLYSHASRDFCESRGLKALTAKQKKDSGGGSYGSAVHPNLRAIASAEPKEYWMSVFRECFAELQAEAKQTPPATASPAGTPRSVRGLPY